jgi:hypothetical protein
LHGFDERPIQGRADAGVCYGRLTPTPRQGSSSVTRREASWICLHVLNDCEASASDPVRPFALVDYRVGAE